MTKEQIKQNAEEYTIKICEEAPIDYRIVSDAYIAGANSMLDEITILVNYIEILKGRIDELSKSLESADNDIDILQRRIETTTRIKNGIIDQLRNPWISVEERLPGEEEKENRYSNELLIRSKYRVTHFALFDYERKVFINSDTGIKMHDGYVKEWMPIPKGGEQ